MDKPVICPTVTANDVHGYRTQMERLEPFAERVHIDLMDGKFAPTVSPSLTHVWWPERALADIHLMYNQPANYLAELIKLKPHLVIIHFEANVEHMDFAAHLHHAGIQAGLALLHDTTVEAVESVLHSFDHVLIFSGHLGYHGGQADLSLLGKVKQVRDSHPDAEIGWDGGINDQNVKLFVEAGVQVLNVGGYIADAPQPQAAYAKLKRVIEEV